MKIKRNTASLALAMVLGLSLFAAATVAASSTNVGYEGFKATMKEMDHEGATSGQVSVLVTDNGARVLEVNGQGFTNEAGEDFSGELSISDGQAVKDLLVYGQEDSVYVVDLLENGYYQMLVSEDMKDGHGRGDDDKEDHDMTAVEEELLDYFVGDLKENFLVVEADDGSKELIFEMEGSEVPTGLNLLIKAASSVEHRSDDYRDETSEEMPFMAGFDFEGKTELTEDIQIEDVMVKINVDDKQQLESMTSMVTFSGKDGQGVDHEISIQTQVDLAYDLVEVQSIDVEAFDWEVVEHGTEHKGNMGRRNNK